MPVVPDQHGAWAFLALPLALAVPAVSWNWLLIPLTVGWVSAYPLSWATLGALSAPRPARFNRALLVWLAPMAISAVVLAVARPWLCWVGLAYLAVFVVHLGFARRRNERAILNDLILIVECSAMVLVTVGVGAGAASGWGIPWHVITADVLVTGVLCFLVLAGSTLHVKSLIRERRNPRYALASRIYAVASVPVAASLASGWGTGAVAVGLAFLVLALRAFAVRGRPRPAVIGIVELLGLALLAAAVNITAP